MANNQTVETLIEKIHLLINKIGGGDKNRLKNHFSAVLQRFGSRNLQIKLHYIQDIQKHGKEIIEDKKGKLYFFLFLNFWQISNSLREGVEIIFKNPVPKGHLLFNNFENENNRKQLLVQQLEIADCLMNKLVIKLENVLLKPILEKDNVELLKQAVRMSIAPFVKQQHFVLNAFGLQQNLENVCDVNYIHKNPLKLFNEITKKAKNLEEVKNKIFGSILGAFYYIGAELGSNYLNLIKILNESMKLTEEESKNSKIPMKIQINHLFGHFYSQLLTKYGGELEETNFSKWLNKVKEMFLKKPKIVKKKITEPVDDNVRFPELE
uniref:Uncharacterized protein n=1 Tax=Meloidogyne hapla TaxID=6305 RepID=A0A1I8BGS4_MELHA